MSAEDGFLMLSNRFNYGTELSPVAFRIAAYLASKPGGWIVREADVRKRCKQIGHKTYQAALSELERAGYLQRGAYAHGGRRPPMVLGKLRLDVVWAGQEQSPIGNIDKGTFPTGRTSETEVSKTEVSSTSCESCGKPAYYKATGQDAKGNPFTGHCCISCGSDYRANHLAKWGKPPSLMPISPRCSSEAA